VGFTAEQECPQCGAPIELEETDRLFLCPYCNVKNFISAPDCLRFVLPNKDRNRDIIYAPYLRFRGSVFSCGEQTIGHRVVDITHPAVPFKEFPVSLGLRPQAMRMKFLRPGIEGTFLKSFPTTSDLLDRAARHSSLSMSGPVFYRAFIGEALSLIYLPLFVQDETLFDAITERPIAKLPSGKGVFSRLKKDDTSWGVTFLATLCPNCGWNLEGVRDSVVLLCPNCQSAWEASGERFCRVDFKVVAGEGKKMAYLPFWRMSATVSGITIKSYADFIRVTNQPKVIQKDWEEQQMGFWSPAFKIRPKLLISLLRQLNLSRKRIHLEEAMPQKEVHPVTLPLSEAAQTIKLAVAVSTVSRKKVFPLLPGVGIRVTGATLIYLPFARMGHELVQPETGVSIPGKALDFGRYL
jgi:predicted RNA-binding Zn-ribbon protein involved in translation (DUF1610 family)